MSEVLERLKDQRRQLAEAQEQLAAAKEARKVLEVARLTALVAALEEFITEDEREASAEADALNTAEGERLYREIAGELAAGAAALEDRILSAEEQVRAVARVCADVNKEFITLLWLRRAIELLRLRYPNMASAAIPPLRQPPNLAPVLFEIEGATPDDVPRPLVSIIASYTPEQRTLAGFDGLRAFLDGYAANLPKKVREFFARAGVPIGFQELEGRQARKRKAAKTVVAEDERPAIIGTRSE